MDRDSIRHPKRPAQATRGARQHAGHQHASPAAQADALTAAQRAFMRAHWGRPGTPFATPDQFAAMLADRERLAEALDALGDRAFVQDLRRNNAAMAAFARELDAGTSRPGRDARRGHRGRRRRRVGR
jgi:hypothetical protein